MYSQRHASMAMLSVLLTVAIGPPDRVTARQAPVGSERPTGPIVDFVAVDADGTPVADLQPSEVEIRIGDRIRVVRSVRRVTTALAINPSGPVRIPAPYGTNDGVSAGRRFVLVVDQESFGAGREQLFRNAVEGLLAQLMPADQTMIAALPFGGVRLPFTSDKARVRLAIDRVSGQGARSETGSDLACRTRRFLESLEAWLREQPSRTSPLTLVLSRRAWPRRGGTRPWVSCRACASSSSISSVTSLPLPALRARTSTSCSPPMSESARPPRGRRSAASATVDPITRSKASNISRASLAASGSRSMRPARPRSFVSRERARPTTSPSSTLPLGTQEAGAVRSACG